MLMFEALKMEKQKNKQKNNKKTPHIQVGKCIDF